MKVHAHLPFYPPHRQDQPETHPEGWTQKRGTGKEETSVSLSPIEDEIIGATPHTTCH